MWNSTLASKKKFFRDLILVPVPHFHDKIEETPSRTPERYIWVEQVSLATCSVARATEINWNLYQTHCQCWDIWGADWRYRSRQIFLQSRRRRRREAREKASTELFPPSILICLRTVLGEDVLICQGSRSFCTFFSCEWSKIGRQRENLSLTVLDSHVYCEWKWIKWRSRWKKMEELSKCETVKLCQVGF